MFYVQRNDEWKITITYCLCASLKSPEWKVILLKENKQSQPHGDNTFSADGALPQSWIGPVTTLFSTLPRENGLFCIKLLSVVHQNLIFYPAETHSFTGKL